MTLLHVWEHLYKAGTPGASQRINSESPLAQYCGISQALKPTFFTLTIAEPYQFSDLKSLRATKTKRNDGRWLSSLELLDSEFIKEFNHLCAELVRAADAEDTESKCLSAQKAAFDEWLDFFRRDRSFTEEIARGLFGELKYMQEANLKGEAWGQIIKAWMGPFGGQQDFVFSDFRAREIKTIKPSVIEVQIASEHQLDFAGELELIVYRLQEVDPANKGETLVDLVSKIESQLTAEERSHFRKGLAAVGFDPENTLAKEISLKIGEKMRFEVSGDDFPRITASKLLAGVTRVQYKLSLSSLRNFESEAHEA
jgi:hypothetical protein